MTDSAKALKKRYAEIIEVVRASIHKLDPYGLLASGSPLDEFDAEIARIATRALEPTTPHEFATFISSVLTDSLGAEYTVEDCLPAAKTIVSELRRRGLTGGG